MYRSFFVAAMSIAALASSVNAQQATGLTCVTSSQPPLIHIEGLSERVGDIVFDCSGASPNSQLPINFSFFLNVNITNRINALNQTDAVITANTGSGPVVVGQPGILVMPTEVSFDGVPVPTSSTGTVQVRVAGLRANATQLPAQSPFVTATISVATSTGLAVTTSSVTVGKAVTGLYSSESGRSFTCSQSGSAAPAEASFAAFVAKHVPAYTIRATEGYAYSLTPKNNIRNLGGDTGTRILLQYSGAPAGTVFYIPDVVAGSDAVEPTSVGDYNSTLSGGKYDPAAGALLLARVYGADAHGAGGTPVYQPGAPGSGAVSFDKVGAVTTTDGSAYAVYEVVDAKDNVPESAQIPVFVTFPRILNGLTYTIADQVSLAPVSSVPAASSSAPIPRFTGVAAQSDCPLLHDCVAPPTPLIRSVSSSADFSAGTVVPGSLATVMGDNFTGKSLLVTFENAPASLLYNDKNQINIRVPDEVAGMPQAKMSVLIDGQSDSQVVPLQAFSPGVFPGAVLNQNNAVNSPATPAHPGTVIQIWGTGISANGKVTAIMGGQPIGEPAWWGPAPGIPGVQQVNIKIPADLQFTDNTTTFSICEASAAAPDHPRCSPARPLSVSQ